MTKPNLSPREIGSLCSGHNALSIKGYLDMSFPLSRDSKVIPGPQKIQTMTLNRVDLVNRKGSSLNPPLEQSHRWAHPNPDKPVVANRKSRQIGELKIED